MRPRLDPELGVAKKDDDLYSKGKASGGWRAKSSPRVLPRKTFKRLGLLVLLAVAVYVFIHNIPTDLGPQDAKRRPQYGRSGAPGSGIWPSRDTGPVKPDPVPVYEAVGDHQGAAVAVRDYDGPVRFLELAESLHAISETKGSAPVNRNVLFIASTVASANALLPFACQMGKELRSYVHFAFISRSEIGLNQLREVNGIDEECHIIFHDARPEFAATSTDDRFAKAVARAIFHINNYMHPQAILIDSSEAEDALFHKALREQAFKMGLQAPIIDLPTGPEERLGWMTKLDPASLSAWNRLTIDILIHAHSYASGSLIRLLKSLSAADYTASAVPHLTIELPENIDPPTRQFLADFRWPPRSAQNPSNINQLTIRHRISRHGLTEEESSVRFLESFWPADPANSHVLVLSPQVELAPNFFQYLKMTVLEYRYAFNTMQQGWYHRLFGISLDLPATSLSGSGALTPPARNPTIMLNGVELEVPLPTGPTTFLGQAPNSNAVLFTGERWVELHSFVSKTLEVQHRTASPPALLAEKSVSKSYPAWMEHALRLCRARGYWTLYPSANLATNLATIHNELYQPPEEYDNADAKHADEDEVVIHRASLLDSLPLLRGQLPKLQEMPLLGWDGARLRTIAHLDMSALVYAGEFRQTVGGCGKSDNPHTEASLFCNIGEEEEEAA